jgi:hypothetical protein
MMKKVLPISVVALGAAFLLALLGAFGQFGFVILYMFPVLCVAVWVRALLLEIGKAHERSRSRPPRDYYRLLADRLLSALIAVVNLTFWGALVYIAVHFIIKIW